MHQSRVYRNLAGRKNLVSFRVVIKETDLHIHAARRLEHVARELVFRHRGYVENVIAQHPEFLHALVPWQTSEPLPPIVQDMVLSGEKAGVGPMAAVAGAIAEHVGLGLLAHTDEVIVENGGDLFIRLNSAFTVGVWAGRSPLSSKFGIRMASDGRPVAVCTSSGTVGHSLSRGRADAACVVSRSCALADAAATAVGNRLQAAEDIPVTIDFAQQIPGVLGIILILGDRLGVWGDVQLVPLQ